MELHKDVENFAIHMFCGLVIVHFFNETVRTPAPARSCATRRLVQKMALPREMFPVASMLVSAFHIGPQLVILTIAVPVMGWAPDPMGMLAVLLALLITMCAGTAIALLLQRRERVLPRLLERR